MDQQKIGRFLKALRREKGLTQEALAERLGVTGRSVSRWENASSLPELSLLMELADFYGVELREILDGERMQKNMDKKIEETAVRVCRFVLSRLHGAGAVRPCRCRQNRDRGQPCPGLCVRHGAGGHAVYKPPLSGDSAVEEKAAAPVRRTAGPLPPKDAKPARVQRGLPQNKNGAVICTGKFL